MTFHGFSTENPTSHNHSRVTLPRNKRVIEVKVSRAYPGRANRSVVGEVGQGWAAGKG